MARAREAHEAGRCRRETPITLCVPDGTIVEGVVDLAFEQAGSWTVVDFKTNRELDSALEGYQRQVALYAEAIARATGQQARAVLLRV
jgi:ATP-dependent helicase/nuclease subunit A